MSFRKTRQHLMRLLLALVVLGGCGGTEPLPEGVGHIVFVISGAQTASFDVTSNKDHFADGEPYVSASYAQGYPNSQQVVIQIVARDMIDSVQTNRVFLQTPKTVAGSYGIGTDCSGAGPSVCGHGLVAVNEDYRQLGSGQSFVLVSGTIWLLAVQGDRVRGRFSGAGRQLNPDVPGEFLEPAVTVQIDGGSFDVPFSPSS